MRILGIETSFDDLGVAIYDKQDGLIVNHVVHQNYIHYKYGGVIPELAAREYIYTVAPLIKYVFKKNNISFDTIDGIAYTAGPGLSGSLLVGASVSCALAYSCNIPAIPIHHMEGHLLSCMLNISSPQFPFLALLVSGKHTQLIYAYSLGKYKIIGETRDDAIGEVFDKIAKALNLGYPGGEKLSQFAKNGKSSSFCFPQPMKYHDNLDFSFSGLKTFTLKLINNNRNKKSCLYDIAYGFENAAIDVLVYKSCKALKKTGLKRLVIAGGVSSNINLLKKLRFFLLKDNYKLYYPSINFCTDNAAMIAYTGMMRFKYNRFKKIDISVFPKWLITDISNI